MDWSGMWGAVPMALGGVIVGLLGWLGTRASADSKRDEAEITTRGEEWQRIVNEVTKWADRRIAEQDQQIGRQADQIDRQDKKIGSLEGKVGHLEQENEQAKTKYWKAIFYSRSWRLLHPESIALIEVPPEIEPDL